MLTNECVASLHGESEVSVQKIFRVVCITESSQRETSPLMCACVCTVHVLLYEAFMEVVSIQYI